MTHACKTWPAPYSATFSLAIPDPPFGRFGNWHCLRPKSALISGEQILCKKGEITPLKL